MTTQLDLFAEQRAVVSSVAHDWRADEDWMRFVRACLEASVNAEQLVHVGDVRRLLTNDHGLTVAPRRLSAFWNRAASRAGFLDFAHWETNDDHDGRNAGRPARCYRLRT